MNDDFRAPERPHLLPVSLTSNPKNTPHILSSSQPIAPPLSKSIEVERSLPHMANSAPKVTTGSSPPRIGTSRIPALKLLPAFTKRRPDKRVLLILGSIGLAVVIAATATSYVVLHNYKPTVAKPDKVYVPAPKITTVASMLTGLPVDPSINKRPVTAIMIENSDAARPQSGLDQAGVVFEAFAEGGVTRFVALYQDSQPGYVGPVRSARPYYIQWLLGFDAAYAHVGGSPDALQDISTWNVKDLNEFYNANAYERTSTRDAPHNVYTSIAQLNQAETSKGYITSKYSGFPRKKEAPSKTPNASSIDMTFSGPDYNVHYDYNTATNSYKRSEAGASHMELNKDGSTVQITPKVVIAMVVPEQNGALDSSGAYYADYAVIGSGQVTIFQDGTVETGTWTKTSNTSQITFTDAKGQPLGLNPGQTWIDALSTSSDLSYK